MHEMLEREFFGAELLEGPVHQFVRPALMIGMDDGVGFNHESRPGVTQLLIDDAAHAEVALDDCAGARSWKHELLFLQQGAPEDGSTETISGFATVTKLEALPDIFAGLSTVMIIGCFGKRLDHGLDVAVESSVADEADVEFLHLGEEFLVIKAGIHADEDGNGLAVAGANHAHHVANHLRSRVAIERVLVSATEHSVDDVSPPGHFKRLEALDFLIGRLDSLSFGGLVVVHDHGVDAQHDHFGPGNHEPPEEKLRKLASKRVGPLRGKRPVETLEGRRREGNEQKIEAGPARQAVARYLDIVEEFRPLAFALGDPALHLMDETFWSVDWMELLTITL